MNFCKIKLVLLLLAVCLLLSACLTGPPIEQSEESSEQSTNFPSEILLTENGSPRFDIVYSADSGYENLSIWVKQVQTALQKRTEVSFLAYDDSKEPRKEYLILIGDTDYSESALALTGLGTGGFSVTQNGNYIVINGKDSAGMVKAVNRFCNTMLTGIKLSDNGKSALLPFEAVSEVGEPFPDLSIEGTPISAYTIVYPNGNDRCEIVARNLRTILNEKCGVSLSVSNDNSEQRPLEILVGYTNREASQNHCLGDEIGQMEYGYRVLNKKISIQGYNGNGYGLESACKNFLNTVIDEKQTKNDLREGYVMKAKVELKEDQHATLSAGADVRVMTANIESEEWGGSDVEPRAELLYANLQYYLPDVVGLQEVSIKWKDSIKTVLDGTQYTLIHEVVKGTDSNYCSILYNTDTLELVKSDAYRLSIGGPMKARTVTWAVFKHKSTGERFAVINTHLDWTQTPDDFTSQNSTTPYSREQQVREISATYNKLKAEYPDADILLTADWNTLKDAHPLNVLTELTDVRYAEDVISGHNWTGVVDHIFVKPNTNVVTLYLIMQNVTDLGLSDHSWGFADVALKK